MDLSAITQLITNLGFPIVCVIGLAWFVYQSTKHNNEAHKQAMDSMTARCTEREEKLYTEIAETRAVNRQAIETIANYAAKLDNISEDIKEIKAHVVDIKLQGA